jgi:DNA end-binding protein Ku
MGRIIGFVRIVLQIPGMPMPARPYWTGSIRLSLVVLPVQIFSAVDPAGAVHFQQIHKRSGKRVRYQKIVEGGGRVNNEDIVKGFEISKDRYVAIDPEDLKKLRLETAESFNIVQFVDRNEIDAIYFDEPYFVVPDGAAGQEAFAVIRDALRASRKIGLGQIAVSGREHIAAIQPCGKGMLLETLRYEDDLKNARDFFAGIKDKKADSDQLALAKKLIEQKTSAFAPEKFKDHYESAVRDLIKRKSKGRKLAADKSAPRRSAEVIDFVEALKRSLGKGGKSKPAAASAKVRNAPARSAARRRHG